MDVMAIATIIGFGAAISFFIGASLKTIGRRKLKTGESLAAKLLEKVGIVLLKLGIVAAFIVAAMFLVFLVAIFLAMCDSHGGCFN